MHHSSSLDRRSVLAALLTTFTAGCLPVADREFLAGQDDSADDSEAAASSGGSPAPAEEPSADPSAELREALDRVLSAGLARRLSAVENGAWQVLHGILAYGKACRIEAGGELVPAIDYLLDGGSLAGWDPLPGDLLGDPPRRGVRFELEVGSMSGQGHYDQWLAVLSQADLPAETPLKIGSESYTLGDGLQQMLWDIPRNLAFEYSWTLIAATRYLPTDYSWPARDGRRWSIEELVDSETHNSLTQAACGGTHRLIGLAMARNRHLEQGGNLTGVWLAADARLREQIEAARRYQNSDGSFSTNFLDRPGWSSDLSDVLRTTGHVLEFLAIAAPEEMLRAAWMEAAATRLCEVLEATEHVELECGALYHALHGVVLYRQRRFG
ncbi:ADP-ribosylation factor-directed GTPase activating protein isoform b [Candidatus Laterigemmans baculatus]|uniref:ADP-ribosylation factor-directed GTPase activating protein isoform b n=1 Tax=Candidatus Laterigemmans baculatus TaxID=2770505 RepID=UPI0013DD14FF|nr:ADP-ribosylation factor-directed GTPase activating protein isoform b [Candidatus Laterigemmans baculatus]